MKLLETLGLLTTGTYNQWQEKGKHLKLYDIVPSLKAYHPEIQMTGDEMATNVESFFRMMGAKVG